MKSLRILTNNPSDGATNLMEELKGLGVKCSRLRNDNVGPKQKTSQPAVKWGCFAISPGAGRISHPVLNGNANSVVLDKLQCLSVLSNTSGDDKVPVVEFTQDQRVACGWASNGERVYCRQVLRGSGGDGIVVAESESQVVNAPLYTKGVKGKRREYRIHVFDFGGVQRVFIQQKLRRKGFDENEAYDSRVRNLDHGWVFAHNEIVSPKDQTVGAAVAACKAFDLQFGAVDIIETDKGGRPYVLEINTAPGLEGATCTFYANCLKDAEPNV